MTAKSEERIDRRQTRDATETRILEGTTRLLDAGASLAGLSINRISGESGVSRATFYLHFADKRALIERLAARELREVQIATAPFVSNPAADRDELAAVITNLVAIWRNHAGVLASLIELAEYDADSRETWQQVVQAIAAQLAPAIRDRRPDLDEAMVVNTSEVLAWTGERTMHQMIGREADDRRAADVAAALTEVIWRIVGET